MSMRESHTPLFTILTEKRFMQRLILMRHAKTEPWYEGTDDHGRALTRRGHSDAVLIGEALCQADWRPDLVLVSTARRARETWLDLAPLFGNPTHQSLETLYLTGLHGLRDIIGETRQADCLRIIGHNPGLHDLAQEFVRKAGSRNHNAAKKLSQKMPTGAAALFSCDANDDAHLPVCRLEAFLWPRALR